MYTFVHRLKIRNMSMEYDTVPFIPSIRMRLILLLRDNIFLFVFVYEIDIFMSIYSHTLYIRVLYKQ